MPTRFPILASILCMTLLPGCEDTDTTSDLAHDSCEGRDFSPTTSFSGPVAGFTATMTDAAPPEASAGLNTWTFDIDAPDGSMLTLTPYMPIHGHGTSPEDFTGVVQDGSVQIGPFDLLMPGPWTFTLAMDDDEAEEFTLCVGG